MPTPFGRFAGRMSIRGKMLLLVFSVCLVLSSVVFFTTSEIYERSLRAKTIGYNLDTIQSMNAEIDTFFSEIERTAILLSNSAFVQAKFTQAKTGTQFEKLNLINDMENVLKLIESLHADVQVPIFLDDEAIGYLAAPSEQINYDYDFHQDNWYRYMTSNNLWKALYRDNRQLYYKEEYRKPVITYIQKFNNIYTLNTYGYILLDIDMKQFEKFNVSALSRDGYMTIVDQQGETVFSSAQTDIPADFAGRIPPGQTSGHFQYQYRGDPYLVIYDTSDQTGWKIYDVVSLNKLTAEIRRLRDYFLLFMAVAFLGVTAIFQLLTMRYITNPIRRLAVGVQQLKRGRFDISVRVGSRDEIGLLTNEFNQMVKRIDGLIQENHLAELLRKDAQLELLQQQINPHFLYNTLETVIGMSSEGKSDEAIAVCTRLGNLLRYNLNGRKTARLEDEVNQIRDYVGIMAMRFGNRFEASYEIEERALPVEVPKFILQPLVENAIQHGLQDRIRDGRLRLRVALREDRLTIAVSDNGRGMTEEVMGLILNKLARSGGLQPASPLPGGRPSLGLLNVHSRLKLRYGDAYEIGMESAENKGTTVTLNIGLEEEMTTHAANHAG